MSVTTTNNKDNMPTLKAEGMESARIEFLGVKILVTMPKGVFVPFMSRSPAVLPTVNQSILGADSDLHIYSEYGKPALMVRDDLVYLSSTTDKKQFAVDVMLATSKFLEKLLNQKGIYSFHASAISYKDEATIILGQPGAGKTTVAMGACYIDNEIKLVSGSRFFVQNESIVAGIASMDIRRGSIISDLGKNLRGAKPASVVQSEKENSAWDARITLNPEEESIKMNTTYPIRVKDFVLVKRLPKQLSVISDQIDRDSFLSRIYDAVFAFSEQIPWYVLGSKIPYPDIFGTQMKKERLEFGDRLLGSKKYVYLEGTLEDISSHLANKLKEKARN